MKKLKTIRENNLLAEIYKHRGGHLTQALFGLQKILKQEVVSADSKNAMIVNIFKRKENSVECSYYRGISLLNVARKVLARILRNQLQLALESALDQSGA